MFCLKRSDELLDQNYDGIFMDIISFLKAIDKYDGESLKELLSGDINAHRTINSQHHAIHPTIEKEL